jgi:hypothetical protein
VFPIIFKTGQAEPLVRTRIQRPRSSRGASTEQAGDMNRSRPQTRPFHGREQAQDRTPTHFIHVCEQSANALSPRVQTRQQTVRIRDQATASTGCDQGSAADTNRPQTVRNLPLSTATISPLTNIGREPRLIENSPSRCIVVSIFPPISFPVRIRILPVYDLI